MMDRDDEWAKHEAERAMHTRLRRGEPAMTDDTRARIYEQPNREYIAEKTRARAAAEAALEGWTRLQEKRCDEGEWVQLRNLFTAAIADAVAQAVKERDAYWQQWVDEYNRTVQQKAEEIARLRAALTSIAANTCCDRCQEAALVAQAALRAPGQPLP